MKPVITAFVSPDVDLEDYRPRTYEEVNFLLQLLVSPAGQDGGESLQLTVCTPQNLLKQLEETKTVFGRGLVIVDGVNIKAIKEEVRRRVESIEALTWDEVARRLEHLGQWEFEDYWG